MTVETPRWKGPGNYWTHHPHGLEWVTSASQPARPYPCHGVPACGDGYLQCVLQGLASHPTLLSLEIKKKKNQTKWNLSPALGKMESGILLD